MTQKDIISSLPFHTREGEGEIALYADKTVQVTVPPSLREELEQMAEAAQTSSLKWGTSLVVGLAALGGWLHHRDRRTASGMAFALSGVAGLVARRAKKEAARWPRQAFAPVPASSVTIKPDSSGKLVISIRLMPPAPPYNIVLQPDEYDAEQARVFQANLMNAATFGVGACPPPSYAT